MVFAPSKEDNPPIRLSSRENMIMVECGENMVGNGEDLLNFVFKAAMSAGGPSCLKYIAMIFVSEIDGSVFQIQVVVWFENIDLNFNTDVHSNMVFAPFYCIAPTNEDDPPIR
ncbi:hypothetical protein LOTGIDRAFT_175801 [Lottia gigantea]|uniref:Uncharacterized protein n=1 Tax=Lottia gigantea TaxID=225164 RepID=V4A6W0_LOTGI|nr:hypothetical protein LOTGIDRAFT_175801 [Lottia gigantea]ESO90755.1 hypothetical protein LOTGIDRAFT_175801 [Lottia gigantea]